MQRLDFKATSATLFITLVTSYVLCLAGDVLFGWTMYQAWAPLLPGFTWPLTAGGTLIGLIWLTAYSFYLAALLVFPYNAIVSRRGAEAGV